MQLSAPPATASSDMYGAFAKHHQSILVFPITVQTLASDECSLLHCIASCPGPLTAPSRCADGTGTMKSPHTSASPHTCSHHASHTAVGRTSLVGIRLACCTYYATGLDEASCAAVQHSTRSQKHFSLKQSTLMYVYAGNWAAQHCSTPPAGSLLLQTWPASCPADSASRPSPCAQQRSRT
jgi:hypothetical protein